MDITTESTTPDFASTHPELHHYTNFQGLEGIYESRTLWATNYRGLNDGNEIIELRQPLVEALTKRFETLLRDRQRRFPHVRRAIQQTGGGVAGIAADQASRLVQSFYDTLLRSDAPLHPHVVSFCTHAGDGYAREHGLLSQWRGYGGAGGYCIVFDTESLVDLLRRESAAHYWVMPVRLDSVHYRTAGFSIETTFAPLLDESERLLSALIDQTEVPEIVMAYFLWAAPLLKHQGFREENEARIVAIPATPHDLAALRAEHGDVSVPPFKAILSRDGRHGKSQYLSLFESLKIELPIKRVIVGPSRQQDENVNRVHELLGSKITVMRSATPFIGSRLEGPRGYGLARAVSIVRRGRGFRRVRVER